MINFQQTPWHLRLPGELFYKIFCFPFLFFFLIVNFASGASITLSDSLWRISTQIIKVNTAEPEISFLILYPLLPFQNLLPTLPTMQQPLTDITRGSLIDDMQLSLELKKTLYYFFSFFFFKHMHQYSPRHVNTFEYSKLVEVPTNQGNNWMFMNMKIIKKKNNNCQLQIIIIQQKWCSLLKILLLNIKTYSKIQKFHNFFRLLYSPEKVFLVKTC